MKFKNLKPGECLSETQYYKVEKIVGSQVQLKNDNGDNIVVDSKYVDTCLVSAEQAEKEEKITKTEAAALFIENPYVVMKASYNKQVKDTDVIKEIMAAYEGSTPKSMGDAVKRAVKLGLQGEERIITGRHFGNKDEFGRINFIDMELDKTPGKEYDTRLRLVDPRTLNWFILKDVKYTVKQ